MFEVSVVHFQWSGLEMILRGSGIKWKEIEVMIMANYLILVIAKTVTIN